jgi:hypothetical protein
MAYKRPGVWENCTLISAVPVNNDIGNEINLFLSLSMNICWRFFRGIGRRGDEERLR